MNEAGNGNLMGRILAAVVIVAAVMGARRLAYGRFYCPFASSSCCAGAGTAPTSK